MFYCHSSSSEDQTTCKQDSENGQTTKQFSSTDSGGLGFKSGPTINGEESSYKNVQKVTSGTISVHEFFFFFFL